MRKWIARVLAAAMLLSLLCISAQAAEPYEEVTFEATGMMFGHVTGKVTISQARVVKTDYGTVAYYAVPKKVTVTVTPYGDSDGKASLVGLRYYDVVASDGGGEVYDNMDHALLTSAGTLKEIGDYDAFWAVDKYSDEYALTADKAYTFTIDTTQADRIDLLCSRPNDLGVEQVAVLRCEAAQEAPAEETPAVKNPFTDVAETSAYYDGILWAVQEGITTGRTATTFVPGENCTEANILTFLWRAQGEPKAETAGNPFGEAVSETAYYYGAALWAYDKGMIDETFAPNTACTRAQAVTFMWKAAGEPEAAASTFTDVAEGANYAAAVNWAVAQNVTKGTGDGTTFSPAAVCTRGQIATFLYRADSAAA